MLAFILSLSCLFIGWWILESCYGSCVSIGSHTFVVFYPPFVQNYGRSMLYGDDVNCLKCVLDAQLMVFECCFNTFHRRNMCGCPSTCCDDY